MANYEFSFNEHPLTPTFIDIINYLHNVIYFHRDSNKHLFPHVADNSQHLLPKLCGIFSETRHNQHQYKAEKLLNISLVETHLQAHLNAPTDDNIRAFFD